MIRAHGARIVRFGRGGTVHGVGAVIVEHTLQRFVVNKGILQAVQTRAVIIAQRRGEGRCISISMTISMCFA